MEKKFLEQAKAERIIGLKGHRLVGSIRASIFNGMEIEEAEKFQIPNFKNKNKNKKCFS